MESKRLNNNIIIKNIGQRRYDKLFIIARDLELKKDELYQEQKELENDLQEVFIGKLEIVKIRYEAYSNSINIDIK